MYIEFLPIEENIQNLLCSQNNSARVATNGASEVQEVESLQSQPCTERINNNFHITQLTIDKTQKIADVKILQANNIKEEKTFIEINKEIDVEKKYEIENSDLHSQSSRGTTTIHNPQKASENYSCLLVDVEDDGGDFRYIIPKVPFNTSSKESTSVAKKLAHTSANIGGKLCPPSIPVLIFTPEQTRSDCKLTLEKRILNGYINAASKSIETSDADIELFQKQNNIFHYQHFADNFIESEVEIDQNILEKAQYCEEIVQMGIDFIKKLKRLINLNPSDKNNGQEKKGKRRFEDLLEKPRKFKYRKVENKFPKYIAEELKKDDDEVNSHSVQKSIINFNKPSTSFENLREMDKKHSDISEKSKLRKSIFAAPEVTHRLVKNNSIEIEFSDDEVEYIKTSKIGTENCAKSINKMKNNMDIASMKIPRENDRCRFSSHWPPETVQNLYQPPTIFENRPTYATVLKQINDNADDHIISGQASSLSNSSASTCIRDYVGCNPIRSNSMGRNVRSIIAQERVNNEREKYRQLLERMMPRLYGTEKNFLNRNVDGLSSKTNESFMKSARPLSQNILTENRKYIKSQMQRPFSYSINLEDDSEDLKFSNSSHMKLSKRKVIPTVIVDDDDDVYEIVDLNKEEENNMLNISKFKTTSYVDLTSKLMQEEHDTLPFVEPVNSLQEHLNSSPHLKDDWLDTWKFKWSQKKKNNLKEVEETSKVVDEFTRERRVAEIQIQEKLRKFQIVDPDVLVVDEFPEPIEEESDFIQLTPENNTHIKAAVYGPPDQILISKFNLNITRRDIHTLLGHNWLNDEVINFYMSLITERSEKKHDTHGYPRVYAMNTFFIPRLMQSGHSGVKRWTRKVDLFEKDVIPVPVHVGGVHWCMAIIHLKNRTIKYYDSMGTPNPSVLKALEQYLKDESLDKRKEQFDTSKFEIESVKDVPRQMNGSDCGVFSCMFAEFVTRNRDITFTQQHMEYFRSKMILEIVQGELMQ